LKFITQMHIDRIETLLH